MKRKTARMGGRVGLTLLLILLVCGLLLPTVLTVAGSFMQQVEINDHYGAVFSSLSQGGTYIESDTALTLLPRHGTPAQYVTALLQTPEYLRRLWNSILFVVPIVLGQVAVAAMAAYSLFRCRGKLRSVIFFFYVILMLLPYQVTLLPNYIVADWLGTLGTRWAILLPDIFSPFAVFLLTRYMRRIPVAQLEAAALDGAGEWRMFTSICLPQCHSILWTVAILIFVDYWNMIEQPMILLNDPAQYPLSIYLSNIDSATTGIAFAVATLYMVPSLLLFFYGQRHLVAGLGAAQADISVQKGERPWQRRLRTWMIPALAVVFLTAVGLLTRFSDRIAPQFTPQVTTTRAMPAFIGTETYPLTLPTAALHEDDYGVYVLIAREQTRDERTTYQTARVAVTVTAIVDDTAAIEGDISMIDQVIVTYDTLPAENQYVTLQTAEDT